jgi:hypothetical protein
MPVERLSHDSPRRLPGGFCVDRGTPAYQTSADEVLREVRYEAGTAATLNHDSGQDALISAGAVARSARKRLAVNRTRVVRPARQNSIRSAAQSCYCVTAARSPLIMGAIYAASEKH